ncbi:hypothetical protein L249_2178 [Ophiocordyceps polyrhachis-furcata BCC 54312]|uniref:Inositol-pentakisphosphate 2-kinase n=1 Tax=Ophiocordyceps polyrhachis-furcata BCC 54312 TaxID=1330021 RepID=A0A367LPA4_9HYPO|nr:hypothetical protein L249_2178 [Ophiocordyceps polyrhachis-furcata BCC 54312]
MSVQPQDCAPNRDDSADDCDNDVTTNPSSTSCQCSLAGDEDDSWIAARDMTLLNALDSDPGPRFRRLSKAARPVRLVGEGAANAVFEIRDSADFNKKHVFPPRCSSKSPAPLPGLLLRVAKVPSRDCPPTYNYLFQQNFYQTSIQPLLDGYAVHQELVVIRKSGIVDKLNKLLQEIDSSRKQKFRGTSVGQSDWAFLVQDMRPADPDECLLIEFKPKWLCQSPSAPPAAVRCRQCAMELRNLIKNPERDLPETKPCPLTLANPDAPSQARCPFRIAPQLAGIDVDDNFRRALETVANHPALRQLKTQQQRHDRLGPLASEPSSAFLVAMTLRDCTCFVQIPRHQQEPLLLRLGDFDWKDPQVKFKGWRKAEQDLIDGAFYTADLILCGDSYYHPPTLCALECAPRPPRADLPHLLNIQRGTSMEIQTEMKMFNHRADVTALQQRLEKFRIAPTEEPLAARRRFLTS